MKNDARKIYKFIWPSASSLFCEDCMTHTVREGDYQSCLEQQVGKCILCGYERDENAVNMEKINLIDSQIKEMERLIEKISSLKREIRIDQLVFHRVEKYDNLVAGFTDPVNIRQSLQFPITLGKEITITLIKEHIEHLKRKKRNI